MTNSNVQRDLFFSTRENFVSSMQGVYNAGKYRGQFSFRHGDAVLFAIGSAQVLYAFSVSAT